MSELKLHSTFHRDCSTVFSDTLCILDRGDFTQLTLLDLSAAFDSVEHATLLSRLEILYRIGGTVLDWFKSYQLYQLYSYLPFLSFRSSCCSPVLSSNSVHWCCWCVDVIQSTSAKCHQNRGSGAPLLVIKINFQIYHFSSGLTQWSLYTASEI